ncbi:cell adhesion molecule Dscam1-like isoform X2 [Paramormyrops kingsleyae]|uniref:cell adhesion molecule Dscam1-like isoform X2 n=1 Tax=Paramormyrops kingsleyae TaxID=1676925 RepID=UPI003B975A27
MKNLVVLFVFGAILPFSLGQSRPRVTIKEQFLPVYLGDTIVLTCSEGGNVKWYFNDIVISDQTQQNYIFTIKSTSAQGQYACEGHGSKSDAYNLKIEDSFPPVVLVIQSGHSVVYKDDSVLLALYVDDCLNWTCYVYKKQGFHPVIIKDYPKTGPLKFMTCSVEKTSEPYIYWCKNKITNMRSSTVVLTVTDLMVKLVPHPAPPELGKDLELECVVHGAPTISNVIFYKDNNTGTTTLTHPQNSVKYLIENMTKTDEGNYKCEATFTNQASSSNSEFTVKSVPQKVVGIEVTLVAVMSYTPGNPVCTCSECRSDGKSEFYEIVNGHYKKDENTALSQGKYACRVRWDTGASSFSLPYSVFGAVLPFSLGQSRPTVNIKEQFLPVYLGDTIVLTCSEGGNVKWYFNNTVVPDQTQQNYIFTIKSTSAQGQYVCEGRGSKSDAYNLKIEDSFPPEILVTQSGHSVVYKDDSVLLALYVDDCLNWTCYVYKKQRFYHVKIKDYPKTGPLEFWTSSVEKTSEPYIYWCKKKNTNMRSSTVVLAVTDRWIQLVPNPALPELGKQLELECIVRGAPKIKNVIFYKDGKAMLTPQNDVKYLIENMTKTDEGNYECEATYTFQASSSNSEFTVKSEPQKVIGIEVTLVAVMSYTPGNPVCTCSKCRRGSKSEFYEIENGHYKKDENTALSQGKYACRVRWDTGASSFSLPYSVSGEDPNVLKIVVIVTVGYFHYFYPKRRNKQKSEALYQEVPLDAVKSDKGEGGYEELKGGKRGERRGEYDTLKGPDADKVTTAEVSDTREQGGYEVLKVSQDDSRRNEYQTLKGEGGKEAEGGYKALKTSKAEEDAGVYHTLSPAGEQGAGYEALKLSKAEGKEGEYQTIQPGGN